MARYHFLVLPLVAALAAGCMPRTIVRKNPGHADRGVRYYRPKPYLRIAPHVNKQGEPSAAFVSIALEYLPDFSEEYSIHVRSGLGTNKTSIRLDNGWNLTELNVDIDSKTAENIEAVGSLLGEIPRLAAGARPGVPGDQFVVQATNVPIGYYEAVVGERCGRRHLYGFRYVGFMPYAACPQLGCGTPEPFDCQANGYDIYGLVFENGTMTFKNLGSLGDAGQGGVNRYVEVEDVADTPR